jgi:hypothetical protein
MRRVMSSSTGTTQKYRYSPSRPRCTPRIYPRQSPVVTGKLHQALSQAQILNALGVPFVLEGPFGEGQARTLLRKASGGSWTDTD